MPTLEGWQQLAEFRESAVLNLRKENIGLQEDLRKMKAEVGDHLSATSMSDPVFLGNGLGRKYSV